MAEINKPENLSKTWARSGEKREPSDAKKDIGWVLEIPTYQDFNWLDGRQDEFIAHVNQHGIPIWDSTTEYQAFKSYVMGSDGNIYVAKTTNTNNDPVADLTEVNWIAKLITVRKSLPVINPNLTGSWGNISTAFQILVSDGVLHIQGNITGGTITNGTVIVASSQLPSKYRPSANRLIPIIFISGSTPTPAYIQVGSDGNISIQGITSNSNVIISGSTIL